MMFLYIWSFGSNHSQFWLFIIQHMLVSMYLVSNKHNTSKMCDKQDNHPCKTKKKQILSIFCECVVLKFRYVNPDWLEREILDQYCQVSWFNITNSHALFILTYKRAWISFQLEIWPIIMDTKTYTNNMGFSFSDDTYHIYTFQHEFHLHIVAFHFYL